MTDWIDFAVYATFLFALYFAQPTAQQRLIVQGSDFGHLPVRAGHGSGRMNA